MRKIDLVEYIAGETCIAKKDVVELVDLLFEAISNAISEDGKLTIANFGTFSVKTMKARTGLNPRTGEKIEIPEKSTVKFKPAVALKEMVQ